MTYKEKLIDFREDVEYEIHRIKASVRGFFESLYNFWKYRKLIYNDRFYDFIFLLHFIDTKLADMEKNWCVNTWAENDQMTLWHIREARERLKPIIDDDYDLEDLVAGRQQKDVDIFFKYLSKHILGFWD